MTTLIQKLFKKTPKKFTKLENLDTCCEIVEQHSFSGDTYFYRARYILPNNKLGAEFILQTREKIENGEKIKKEQRQQIKGSYGNNMLFVGS